MRSATSSIERARIARALCRFEIFNLFFPPAIRWGFGAEDFGPAVEFLQKYEPDEIDEITCVREYTRRRLWCLFDQIENDFIEGKLPATMSDVAKALDASGSVIVNTPSILHALSIPRRVFLVKSLFESQTYGQMTS